MPFVNKIDHNIGKRWSETPFKGKDNKKLASHQANLTPSRETTRKARCTTLQHMAFVVRKKLNYV